MGGGEGLPADITWVTTQKQQEENELCDSNNSD